MNMHFRKTKKEKEAMGQRWHEVSEQFEPTDLPLKEAENGQEQLKNLKKMNEALQSLKPAEQDLISLKYFEGMSYKEIAEVLNLSVNNVGVKLNRATARLSQLCNFSTS